jgi:hypothetical protein
MPDETRWLLLIHQIPPSPAYLRVKIGRRLSSLGAVPIKNSVYVLPRSDQTLEDFQWVRREIVTGSGEATVCEAHFVEGHTDGDVEALFTRARDADYAALAEAAQELATSLTGTRKRRPLEPEAAKQTLARLRKQLADVAAIDFFGAPGREAVEERLAAIGSRLTPAPPPAELSPATATGAWRGRTWVTRRGVHIDRIASAWLIRRFIDPEATLRFVASHEHTVRAGEVRFDMFEAEFTHDGDLCTFEVLLRHFALRDAALQTLGEIVHDIDLKDAKFERPEAAGVDRLIAGLAFRHKEDEARIAEGAAAFDSLYEYFKRTR